jgi:phage-related protein
MCSCGAGGFACERALLRRRVVVVRAFIKKTQKTPSREIELALNRAKEILR